MNQKEKLPENCPQCGGLLDFSVVESAGTPIHPLGKPVIEDNKRYKKTKWECRICHVQGEVPIENPEEQTKAIQQEGGE